MTNVKISQLPNASIPLTGAELVPLVQTGVTEKATVADFITATSGYTPGGTGAVARSVASKMDDVISVKDFGAIGDGVTNDTDAFNACPAGIVYVPPGTYKLSGFVAKSDTTYYGSAGAILTVASGAASICNIPNSSVNIVFEDLSFVGNASSAAPGCILLDTNTAPFKNNIHWNRCKFSTFGGSAITGGGLKGGSITNCEFTETAQLNIPSGTVSYPAVWLSDSGASRSASSDVIVRGCTFRDMYWSAIFPLGTRILIEGNNFSDIRESIVYISPAASYISVIGNIFTTTVMQDISASGVEIGGNYCVVSDNTFTDCELYGISVQDCISFTVTGNMIRSCGTGIGIITTSATIPPRYGIISGNNVQENERGIRFQQYGVGAVIQDCNIANNFVARNTIEDVAPNINSYFVAPTVDITGNRPIDTDFIKTLVCTSLGTGLQLLFSVGFRPSMIRFDTAGLSDSTGINSGTGFVTFPTSNVGSERCISYAAAKSRVTNNVCVSMWDAAFTTEVLKISGTTITYNTSTHLWDVYATVATNTGTDIWAICTVTP